MKIKGHSFTVVLCLLKSFNCHLYRWSLSFSSFLPILLQSWIIGGYYPYTACFNIFSFSFTLNSWSKKSPTVIMPWTFLFNLLRASVTCPISFLRPMTTIMKMRWTGLGRAASSGTCAKAVSKAWRIESSCPISSAYPIIFTRQLAVFLDILSEFLSLAVAAIRHTMMALY